MVVRVQKAIGLCSTRAFSLDYPVPSHLSSLTFGRENNHATMNQITSRKEIIGGYALAGVTLCLGVYLGTKIDIGAAGSLVIRTFSVIAALTVLKFTFEWGRLRGFSVGREGGGIAVGNLVRNLMMSAIVFVVITVLFGPLILFAFQIAR
jgi:hypothetical protein